MQEQQMENNTTPSVGETNNNTLVQLPAPSTAPKEIQYRIKHVTMFKNKNPLPIILQNTNGPCPLIAIFNVLLLRGAKPTGFVAQNKYISNSLLVQILANYLLEHNNSNDQASKEFNTEQAINLIPNMKDGLHVNLQFNGPKDFEYTPELAVFQAFNLHLVHAWLPNPATEQQVHAILSKQTYNSLQELLALAQDLKNEAPTTPEQQQVEIIEEQDEQQVNTLIQQCKSTEELRSKLTSATRKRLVEQGALVDTWINVQHVSQATDYGMEHILNILVENQLAILFKNNHFATIIRHQGALYQLVTDEGFFGQPNIVWEKLVDLHGNNPLCDGNFNITIDAMVEQQGNNTDGMSDEEIAKQLQEQEDAKLANALQQEMNKPVKQQQQHVPPTTVQQPTTSTQQESKPYIPTIREKQASKPPKAKNQAQKYVNQADQLRQLNEERKARELANPRPTPQQQKAAAKKEQSSECNVM